MEKKIAGFSLGWIFDTVPGTMYSILNFLLDCGTDAVEFCLSLERLKHFCLFAYGDLIQQIEKFKYVSIHLPDIDLSKMDDCLTEKVGCLARLLPFRIDAMVVHPTETHLTGSTVFLSQTFLPLPIAFEFPMDRDKQSGKTLDELKKIRDEFPRFEFVLDVQHAYENDPTGKLAIDAAEIMGPRLRHLHVSGQKQRSEGLSHHSFLYEADNRAEIMRVLAHSFLASVPIISEGEFKFCDPIVVESELACLRS